MELIPANINHLDGLEILYKDARAALKARGINQWQDGYPPTSDLIEDIKLSRLYIYQDNGEVTAAAMYMFEPEPTYNKIYEGHWLTNLSYATVHRVAVLNSSNGKGIGRKLLLAAEAMAKERNLNSIRIDTHRQNLPMQSLIKSCSFKYCGIIYLENGDERLAYEKVLP